MTGIQLSLDATSAVPTLQKAFGPFYNYLFERFGTGPYRFFREGVVDFILRAHPGSSIADTNGSHSWVICRARLMSTELLPHVVLESD